MEMKCHICGNETDFCCESCNQPVCEDCCVAMTYQNQIDYALCLECHELNEALYTIEKDAEYEREEARKAKKEKRRKQQRANYHLPANVEKRRVAKAERNRLRAEQNIRMLKETFKIVGSMID